MSGRDIVEVLQDWPQPDSGAPMPQVSATEDDFSLSYNTCTGKVALVRFPTCHQIIFGHPNDEVLNGHALYKCGLKPYSVHRVLRSSRLAALERANAIHPRHDAESFLRRKEHYVFTFHDSTLECLVSTGGSWAPQVRICATRDEANAEAIGRVV